ncbi:hypothetical protein IQ249_15270 [Lusitaniella coriacea LEGE 07157]|uniref:Uncharacterized protein n=1 Tax=Lusitaniella coriacea LEGE 07157 TaxID=945747 RepID=A0A8J7DY59_9CYAN|nr:hypothetical protein [Lusitaniella coriacea]MBE9117260.1 hypothetical protein [Lusitaniella coriacea LEGE 07157]
MNRDNYSLFNTEGGERKERFMERLSQKLNDLPETPPQEPKTTTLKSIVRELYPLLKAKKAEGYQYKQLVEVLAQEGLTISPESLRKYMAEAEKASQSQSEVKSKPANRSIRSSMPSQGSEVPEQAPKIPPERRARLTGRRFEDDDLKSEFENL